MNFPALVVYGCGSPAVQPDTSRVVNGEEARPHSWPWQVLTPPVLCFYSQVGKINRKTSMKTFYLLFSSRSRCRWSTAAATITPVGGRWSDPAGCWRLDTASGDGGGQSSWITPNRKYSHVMRVVLFFFFCFVQARRCLPRGPGGARHERSGGNRAGARYPPHHRPPRVGHRLRRGRVS